MSSAAAADAPAKDGKRKSQQLEAVAAGTATVAAAAAAPRGGAAAAPLDIDDDGSHQAAGYGGSHQAAGYDGSLQQPLSPTTSRPWKYSTPALEKVIAELPPWTEQLSMRGLIFGTVMGLLFAVITMKLSLGSAGIVPSLNIPAGLISFALMKGLTGLGRSCGGDGVSGSDGGGDKGGGKGGAAPVVGRLRRGLFRPFGVQENAVLQTFILSISGVAFTGGFGTYLTGMGYQTYLNLGGAPRGTPGFKGDEVYDPVLKNTIPYLLMTAVLGVFMLTQMRKLMICDWRLPFPSGTASGIMLTSFHTAAGEASALRKVRVLLSTGAASLLFSMLKWVVSGADYACGFGAWPSFGFKALKYTWQFDWQLNYVGAGMICPHIVNWSMLLGAILSWGFMWPMIEKREGDWYPAGLGPHDFKGLFAYKVFLVIALMMGEGLYMVGRVLLSSGQDTARRLRAVRRARQLGGSGGGNGSAALSNAKTTLLDLAEGEPDALTSERVEGHPHLTPHPPAPKVQAVAAAAKRRLATALSRKQSDKQASIGGIGGGLGISNGNGNGVAAGAGAPTSPRSPRVSLASTTLSGHALVSDEAEDDDDAAQHLLQFKETGAERRLRTEVFLRETIPWWLAPAGYGGLAVVSTICIPLIIPAVKWYYVLTAYIITPLFALPNSYGAGLTDWDNCSMYGKLALFIFAAWAGASGNGIIVGLGVCGVVFGATSSAATLMGDFRTGYICLTAPRAMFVAQLVGQLLGAVLAPVAFLLFYMTGQVNVPGGPYPAPFSDIYRGMAYIGTLGFGALPKYCAALMLAFFLGGMAMCLVRDLLPQRYGRFVPSPMALSLPFYIGAASAIDFWLGSVVMHLWQWRNPAAAEELGPTVGAGLLVGDGVWSIPGSILAIFGRDPPVCMGWFGAEGGCRLPYCVAFLLGGSDGIPGAAAAAGGH